MEVEELVTQFKADISDYRKKMEEIKKELHSISGVTDNLKKTTKNALSSNSTETQKYGKQLQSLINTQTKQAQSALESAKRIEDYRAKSKLLTVQLNQQEKEIHSLTESFQLLKKQYDAQRLYLSDWDGGIDGARKFREEITDTMHHASAASDELQQKLNAFYDLGFGNNDSSVQNLKLQIAEYTNEFNRANQELKIFDNELKSVGLNPENLKSDTLETLKTKMQSTSKQLREFKEASEKTASQLDSANGSILTEQNRLDELKDSLRNNSIVIKNLQKDISNLDKSSVGNKLKKSFSGLGRILVRTGIAGDGVFKKLRTGLSFVKGAAGNTSKSLLNVVKSIRRIGVVSLGLKICKSIFGELRSIVANYLSQNEQLNNRVETLKNAFANALAPALNIVIGLFERLMPYALSVANAISDLFASIGISKSINATATSINGTANATKNLSKAQKDLYGFDQIAKVGDDSSNCGSSGSSTSAPSASNQFSSYLNEIKELWKKGDFEGIGEGIAASCNKVIGRINALDWEGIKNKVSNTVSGIAMSFNGFIKDFDWYGAGETVGNGFNTIIEAVDSFIANFDFESLGSGFAENLNGLFNKIDFGKIGKTISDSISGLFDMISGFLSELDWGGIARKLEKLVKGIDWGKISRSVFNSLGAAFGGIASFIGQFLVDGFRAASDYFSQYFSWNDTPENIIKGLLEGIKDALVGIGEWINNNIFQPFKNGFNDAFEIHSPSQVMKTQGKYIIDGLFDGLGDIWSRIQGKFTSLKTKISEFFTGSDGLNSKMKELGGNLVTKLKEGLKDLKKTFTEMFKPPINGVIELFNSMINKINSKLRISVSSTLSTILSALGIGVNAGSYQLFSIPNIPKLETGGVLKKGQIGFLEGNGDEAVVPLEKNTGWITKLAMQIVQLTESGNNPTNITIPIYVGDKHISTAVLENVNDGSKIGRDIPIQA